MAMDTVAIPKDSNALGHLFNNLINEMKTSTPLWEDFISKSNKLNNALKVVSQALALFFDAFQKIADLATNAQGATKEIGATLTRLCMRQKAMEDRTRTLSRLLVESLSVPLAEKLEGEWKRNYLQLDKDRMKDLKRAKNELKKASTDTLRLKKKVSKKGAMSSSKKNLEEQLKTAMEDMQERYTAVENMERKHVRRALIEERARYCHFITCLKPVLDCQMSILNDMSQVGELMDSLCMQASDPDTLPPESEQLLMKMHAGAGPASAADSSSLGSRKSSMASISSLTSNSSAGSGPSPAHQLTAKPGMNTGALRLSSISSQDSGFTSQDTLYLQGMQVLKNRDYQFMRTASGPSLSSSSASQPGKLPGAEGIVDEDERKEVPEGAVVDSDGGDTDCEEEGEEDEEEDEEDEEDEEEVKTPCTPPPNGSQNASGAQDWPMDRPHTISGAFTSQTSRPSISSLTFEPPAELYPNQALPPPVYANLANLAHAASRKCSKPAGVARSPSPPGTSSNSGPPTSALDHRRKTLPALMSNAGKEEKKKTEEDPNSNEFQAELDRAVSELDRLTADMWADYCNPLKNKVRYLKKDSGNKPPPPMRRNSSTASSPDASGTVGVSGKAPMPLPTVMSAPGQPSSPPVGLGVNPQGLLRSISSGSAGSASSGGACDRPPTSPKPRILPSQIPQRPGALATAAADAAAMPPPPAPGQHPGRRHSSIQPPKHKGDAQSGASAVGVLGRKSSFASATSGSGGSNQPGGSCLEELTSVLKQRKQHQEKQQKQQQQSQSQYQQPNQQLIQQQEERQQQHYQQSDQFLIRQQQHQHQQHFSQKQQQLQQQLHHQFAHQQQAQAPRPPSPDSDPNEDPNSLKSALRAQGMRLKPTPVRNDRSAPNFG